MKIRLLTEWTDGRSGSQIVRGPGSEVSVAHWLGRGLLYSRQALWIAQEEGDPDWIPSENLRAPGRMQHPEKDKMLRGGMNR